MFCAKPVYYLMKRLNESAIFILNDNKHKESAELIDEEESLFLETN